MGGQRNTSRSQCSPSPIWVLVITLRLSDLAAAAHEDLLAPGWCSGVSQVGCGVVAAVVSFPLLFSENLWEVV